MQRAQRPGPETAARAVPSPCPGGSCRLSWEPRGPCRARGRGGLRLNCDPAVEGLTEAERDGCRIAMSPAAGNQPAPGWQGRALGSRLGQGRIPGKKHLTCACTGAHTCTHTSTRTCTCVKTPHGFIGSSQGSDLEPRKCLRLNRLRRACGHLAAQPPVPADPQGVAPTSQTASRRPNRLTWPGIRPPSLGLWELGARPGAGLVASPGSSWEATQRTGDLGGPFHPLLC